MVIWDVDDVLNELMREWFEHWSDRTSRRRRSYDDLTDNPPHEILGMSEREYLESLDAFRRERYETLSPRAETLRWFEHYGDRGHHVALTAAPATVAHLSAAWVVRHFGQWIRTFAFVPSPRGTGSARGVTKADYLSWLGLGDVLVDDRDETAQAVRSMGLKCVVPPQPWNRSEHLSLEGALEHLRATLGFEGIQG